MVHILRVLSEILATSRRVLMRPERLQEVLQQESDALTDSVESLTGSGSVLDVTSMAAV